LLGLRMTAMIVLGPDCLGQGAGCGVRFDRRNAERNNGAAQAAGFGGIL